MKTSKIVYALLAAMLFTAGPLTVRAEENAASSCAPAVECKKDCIPVKCVPEMQCKKDAPCAPVTAKGSKCYRKMKKADAAKCCVKNVDASCCPASEKK